MLLKQLASALTEMAGPAQFCTICGQGPLHKTHTYQGGNWYCKRANLVAAGLPPIKTQAQLSGSTPANTPAAAPQSSSTPPPSPPAQPSKPATPAPVPQPARAVNNNQASLDTKIKGWLKRFGVENYEISDDHVVDVDGDVHLEDMHWKQIPVKFGKVTGSFISAGGVLQTLVNFPEDVNGNVIVSHNELTTLQGCPVNVAGSLSIANNENLKTLEGISQVIGDNFNCNNCPELSLHNIHKHIKFIGGELRSTATSHVLGLLYIRGLTEVTLSDPQVSTIINKHLAADRDIHACQEDLIEAGFGAYAKL